MLRPRWGASCFHLALPRSGRRQRDRWRFLSDSLTSSVPFPLRGGSLFPGSSSVGLGGRVGGDPETRALQTLSRGGCKQVFTSCGWALSFLHDRLPPRTCLLEPASSNPVCTCTLVTWCKATSRVWGCGAAEERRWSSWGNMRRVVVTDFAQLHGGMCAFPFLSFTFVPDMLRTIPWVKNDSPGHLSNRPHRTAGTIWFLNSSLSTLSFNAWL